MSGAASTSLTDVPATEEARHEPSVTSFEYYMDAFDAMDDDPDTSELKTSGSYPTPDGKHPRGLIRSLEYPGARRTAVYGQQHFTGIETVRTLFGAEPQFAFCFGGI